MATLLDHLIVNVNDPQTSLAFYDEVLGFKFGGMDGPFSVVRVNESCVLLLAKRATSGGDHLAFAQTRVAFDATLARIVERKIPYGDAFDSVGKNGGPGIELGARGAGKTVYFFDPNRHLFEIRTYE